MCQYCQKDPHAYNCPLASPQPEPKRLCPNCWAELDDYSEIIYDKETNEVLGCEECMSTGRAMYWIKEE